MRRSGGLVGVLIVAAMAVSGCASGEEHKESAAEMAHEAAMEKQHAAAEKRCQAKGEIIAQGSDETTYCVSQEQKQREIENDTKPAESKKPSENEAPKGNAEEAEKERSGGGSGEDEVGSSSHATDAKFCEEHTCIGRFTTEGGTVVECSDGTYSHAGGIQGACSDHGGEK